MSHRRRSHGAPYPAHVTLRIREDLPDVRGRTIYLAIEDAIRAGSDRFGFRVIHFSALANHLHLIVEADSQLALSRGMQGLVIRLARAINRAAGRTGKVFTDRYHMRDLTTPTEVRNAILYVLNNAKHHAAEQGAAWPARRVDPCSSARWFPGWRVPVESPRLDGPSPTVAPSTWLLRVGWMKAGGLLDPAALPGGRHDGRRTAPRPWLG